MDLPPAPPVLRRQNAEARRDVIEDNISTFHDCKDAAYDLASKESTQTDYKHLCNLLQNHQPVNGVSQLDIFERLPLTEEQKERVLSTLFTNQNAKALKPSEEKGSWKNQEKEEA